MAIEELKFLLECNKRDIIRIQEAHEEELELLAKQLKENPKKADKIIEKMINAKKQTRTRVPNTMGMTSAISELNKMQGFNEQNINVNGTVIFEDEEDLPD
jgi:ornithine carbamoyltransferase